MRVPVCSLPSRSALQQSSQKYEEGERALQEARRIESESQMRLQAVQERFELVKQHEQLLQEANTPSPSLLGLVLPCQGPAPLPTASILGTGQERLSMAHQRRQLEQLCEELRRNPVMPQSVGEDLSAPMSGSSGTLRKASCMLLMGRDMLGAAAPVFGFSGGLGCSWGLFLFP